MSRYLLKISYDGTAYHGWQVQNNAITIQQILCEKLSEILKCKTSVTGCSRTDSGVHAKEFFCHFDTALNIPPIGFIKGLNSVLPADIAVIDCKEVPDDFHARYSAKGKTYTYIFYDVDMPNPFWQRYSYKTDFKLNTDLMNEFCKNLIGTYDFAGFSSANRTVEDTVRTITECKTERNGDFVYLTVTADGFLYNMVRIIAGTALEVSRGAINPNDTVKLINSKNRSLLGPTVPPNGLFLMKVYY